MEEEQPNKEINKPLEMTNYLNEIYGSEEMQQEEIQQEIRQEDAITMEEHFPKRIYRTVEEEKPLLVIDSESHLNNTHDELNEDQKWLLSEEGQLWLSTLDGMNWVVNTEEGQDFGD